MDIFCLTHKILRWLRSALVTALVNSVYLDGLVTRAASEEGPEVRGAAVVAASGLVDGGRSRVRSPRHALHHVLMLSKLHLATH